MDSATLDTLSFLWLLAGRQLVWGWCAARGLLGAGRALEGALSRRSPWKASVIAGGSAL